MSDSIAILEEMRSKLDAKRARLKTQLSAVEVEFQEIDTAIRVLQRIGSEPPAAAASAANDNGAIILQFVGAGESEAKAPKDIFDALQRAGYDLNADLVRTQLWRMAKRGLLESDNGKYWRAPSEDDFSSLIGESHPDDAATQADHARSPQAVVAARGGYNPFDDNGDDVPF